MEIYAIGHSNRTISAFIDLLVESSVTVVVDVRRLPGSHRFPLFDQDEPGRKLARHGIGYIWERELTGSRGKGEGVHCDVEASWRSSHPQPSSALLIRLDADRYGGDPDACSLPS